MVNTFLYPRTCSLHRPVSNVEAAQSAGAPVVGVMGYAGVTQVTTPDPAGISERVLATGLPCDIAVAGAGKATRPGGGLPADSAGPIHWQFTFPKGALAKGAIRDRDILIDDEGNRYQVASAYWTPLGYQPKTVRLQV